MDLSTRWDELLGLGPQGLRLAEGAALIDAHRTGVDPDSTLADLDDLGARCPGPEFDDIHRYVFDTLGFSGDSGPYHHERNSLLSSVVRRRRGLPILLSIVTLDIAAASGVTLLPVGMPGHFLLRRTDRTLEFVDPFHHGALLGSDGCEELFHRSNGPSPEFGVSYLDPIGPYDVLARVLANLKGTYAAGGDLSNMRWVLDLRSRIPGVPPGERFELAAVLAELGRFEEAAATFDDLADRTDGRAAVAAGHRARAMRAREN
jgi:regulator of sirC expression with transglutaminase-like and TPR domain